MEHILFTSYTSLILNKNFMKKLSIATIIAGALIFSACNGNTNSTSTTDSTNTMSSSDTGMNTMNNADTSKATVSQDAVDFVQDAASGGMMEVQLGNIAQKNSKTKAVQDYGKMLVDDHTSANNNLKDIADKKNINIPTTVKSDQQDKIDKLSKETGSDFDKDFISMAVDDHQNDIDKFKKAEDKIQDPDLKDFIAKTLPTLQKHLDKAKEIKKKM
jgi:putative membrane protein